MLAQASLTIWLALMLASTSAGTGEGGVELSVEACSGVAAERVGELLELELGLVLEARDPSRRFRVEVVCSDEATLIAIDDPLTAKRIERRLPVLDASDPEPARTVAIGAAQLFVASWAELELLVPAEHPPPPALAEEQAAALELVEAHRPTEHPPPPASPEQRTVASDLASPVPDDPARLDHVLTLHTGQRGRALGSALHATELGLGYQPRVRVGRSRVTLGPAFDLSVELGSTRAGEGSVEVLAAGGRIAGDLRVTLSPSIGLLIDLGLGFAYQRIRGRPRPGSDLRGSSIAGFGVDPQARLGLAFELGRVDLAVALEGGYLIGGPRGLTPAGAIVLRGPWLGVGLQLELGVRARARGPRAK